MFSVCFYQILTTSSKCGRRNQDSSDQLVFFQVSIDQFFLSHMNFGLSSMFLTEKIRQTFISVDKVFEITKSWIVIPNEVANK